jgi:hypothetical protein
MKTAFRYIMVPSLFALATAIACSSPGAASPGDACGKYYDAFVGGAARCGASASDVEKDLGSRGDFLRFCQVALKAPGTSVTPTFLEGCAAASNAQTGCRDVDKLPECKTGNGTLPVGAACLGSEQCAGGRCKRPSTSTAGLDCGTCEATIAEGGACSTTATSDAFCGRGLSCQSGKCAKPPASVAAGASCIVMEGNSTSTRSCVTGYYCNVTFAAGTPSGTCEKEVTKGEACTERCAGKYVCINKVCSDRVGEGLACSDAECAANLYCDSAAKTCKKPTEIAVGGECNKQGTVCAANTRCDYGTGGPTTKPTCKALLAENAACGATVQGTCGKQLSCIDDKCQFPDANLCK